LTLPKTIEAGSGFSVQSTGSGKATLYIAGPGQAIKREMQLGQITIFAPGSLFNAGRYIAVLASDSTTETGTIDVLPSKRPANLSFLAKPSRLPVGLHNGITGTVYVFDAYQNLIVAPSQVAFELSNPAGATTRRTLETRNGTASVQMDSSPREGKDTFIARVGDISATRIVGQVPGDPCSLKMNARATGGKIQLETDPVRDCSGNAVPDGTIVTFTAAYEGAESTVDVPLKRGVAKVEMPVHRGATISVASGVVLGNQIRWEK
jgi:hypothetical protein